MLFFLPQDLNNMECKCNKETMLTEILKVTDSNRKDIDKFYNLLYVGNGKPAFAQSILELGIQMKQINEVIPIVQKQIIDLVEYKTGELILRGNKKEVLKKWAVYLTIFTSLIAIMIGILNWHSSTTSFKDSENTIITNIPALEQAIREGKNFKFRGVDVTKQYQKNYQNEIDSINK